MRDLKADLELCNKATPGPWLLENNHEYPFTILDFEYADVMATYCTNSDAEFIIQAREGWPHAIERAIEAEVLNRELVEVAEMLLQWWNNGYICQDCPNPSGPARTCISECCSILDDYRQAEKKLIRAKEVLGDV